MNEVKKPWLSKTLIANVIMSIVAISGKSESIGLSSDSLLMALSGINIILRLVTKDRIGLNA